MHILDNTIINAFNNSHSSVVIADISIRNNVTTSIVHIHLYNRPVTKIVHHAVNITTIEAELFAIRCRINQAISIPITNYIVIITNSLYTVIKIFFFKSTIYYTGHNGSPYLQEELYMEYQYPNLFMQLFNTKDY